MVESNFISQIFIEENGLPTPTPEIQHERNLAVYDILQKNKFCLDDRLGDSVPEGPFTLRLSIKKSLLLLHIEDSRSKKKFEIYLSLAPLRPIIKDYFEICKSYFDAVKRLPPSQIETVDMGRRGIHLEGSKVLIERLSGKVKTDVPTAKRLFTLVCALHFK